MASVTDTLGNKVVYRYDAVGNMVQTDAAGSITTMQYDLRGNKIAMQDPAMGSWTYGYNAFGELVTQRDSLNQTTTIAYDALGRMTKRTEPDLVSDWSYDKKFDGTACGKSIGKLCEAKTDNNYKRTHAYDSLGRPSSTATVLDNVASPAVVSETFDINTGRVVSKTWPTGYQATYSYSALGYLTAVNGGGSNGISQTTSYQVLGMTPQGQITQYRTGNNVTVVKNYDPLMERQVGQIATTDGQIAGNVMNQAYRFNALGNLLARVDSTPGVGTQESFSYDSLNRLTTASILGGAVSPPTTTEVMYDQRGNIAYKSDVGRYWYDAARPNRMTNVTLETSPGATVSRSGTRVLSYAFDDTKVNAQSLNGTTVGNGNLEYTVSQDTTNGRHTVRYESYNSFNMPAQIVYGNFVTNTSSTADRTLGFIYGPEHQRIRQSVALSGSGTSSYFSGNTWYLNGEDSLGLSYEKEVRTNGSILHKHYLNAGGTVFALLTTGTVNGLPATSTSYFHQDQMGSISAITSETGAVTERLAYDPWGKRRYINTTPGLTDTLDAITGQMSDRGYTMHEHLDEVGVIHMNGRIYDPLMGRFMSADPIVQTPEDLRSFNRYSYVWNNPMRMFDPTGFEALQTGGLSYGDSNYSSGSIFSIGFGLAPTSPWSNATLSIPGVDGQQTSNTSSGWTRLGGLAQMSGGATLSAVGVTVGLTTGWTGIGTAAALGLTALGADQLSTGLLKYSTGEERSSTLNQVMRLGGASETQAAWGEAGIALAAGFGPSAVKGTINWLTGKMVSNVAAKSEVSVYRAFGGDARAQGFSWTTKDPRTVGNFRDAAGLPSGGPSGATNTADFLIKGQANALDVIKSRSALPLDGNKGGLPELIIDPKNVRITDFSVLKP